MTTEELPNRPISASDVLDYRSMADGGFAEWDILEIYALEWGLYPGDVLPPEEEARARRLTPAFMRRFDELRRLAAEQQAAERSGAYPVTFTPKAIKAGRFRPMGSIICEVRVSWER